MATPLHRNELDQHSLHAQALRRDGLKSADNIKGALSGFDAVHPLKILEVCSLPLHPRRVDSAP